MVSVPATAESVVNSGRFDWYASTINASVDDLRKVLCAGLMATAHFEDGPKNGYHSREVLRDVEGVTVATLLYGGNGDIPHAFASSDAAQDFAGLVRSHWPDRHKVSRFDAAIDFDNGPGTFETLLELCLGIADGLRVEGDTRKRIGKIRTNYMGDWHNDRARTFGLGSYKSAVYVRLYERGHKLRDEAALRGKPFDHISETLVRLEVQVRPAGGSKVVAASSTPSGAWGYAEWSRELLRRLDGCDVPRVHVRERRDSDHERALSWMVKQYERHLLTEVGIVGGWDALGASLRKRLETGDGSPSAWGGSVPF